MKNQWALLFDPVSKKNVAAVVWSPSTNEILHKCSDKKYSDAIDVLLERKTQYQIVTREINGVLASYESELLRDDPLYLVSFLNPILKPTKIGSRGASLEHASVLLEYISNHLDY